MQCGQLQFVVLAQLASGTMHGIGRVSPVSWGFSKAQGSFHAMLLAASDPANVTLICKTVACMVPQRVQPNAWQLLVLQSQHG